MLSKFRTPPKGSETAAELLDVHVFRKFYVSQCSFKTFEFVLNSQSLHFGFLAPHDQIELGDT